ncbi:hypothetical protein DYB37_008937 [Aphanomyces astaci]|uniref:Uncharacterized protein n=1 Tax=Aphanomyces astaci TaxID=112090 RepID=A0A396ZZS9_APHAT|nr:hypothetical protein DYB36_013948 [Aphanomyces astaci]RHY25623.1 hypothetical protein DYB25_004530 [Aphanomyces astaci]RHY42877.1 hypothetical protein DYB38_005935 [Aphanomyces astaci]RHY59571.1 hypothetical protein DYB30_000985 [Aphanomyces astaci]RHY68789.1 hypothetical protein DYB34_008059 [Aphanomyces astaci]
MGVVQRVLDWPHLPMVVFNLILPLVIFNVAKEHTSQIVAVFLSGIPPMGKTLVQVFAYNKKDVISIVQIISTAFSVVIMLFTDNAKVLLVKDSLSTITVGILYFVSVAYFHEDLFFTFRRHFSSKTPEEMDALYALPHVQRASRYLSVVWGFGMIIEAFIRITLIVLLSVQTMVYVSPVIPMVCFWPLGFWSFKYLQKHEVVEGAADDVTKPLLPTSKELDYQVDSLA